MSKKLLICGSRNCSETDKKYVRWAVGQIAGMRPEMVWDIIVGGARGVDTIAEEAARECGLAVTVYPADWKKHGRSAGVIRNQEMVDACDWAMAVWDGKSKGTGHTIRMLEASGKPYEVTIGEMVYFHD